MRNIYFIVFLIGCLLSLGSAFGQCPIVTITPDSASTQLTCLNQEIILKANFENPGGVEYSFKWNTGQNSDTIHVTKSGEYNITVNLEGSACPDISPITITQDTAPPSIKILSFPGAICSGSSDTLVATGAEKYLWDLDSSISSYIIVQPAENTSYKVTGKAANGCTASAIAPITVKPLPDATIAVNPIAYQFCKEPQVVFVGSKGVQPYTFGYTINAGASQTIDTRGTDTAKTNVSTINIDSFTYHLTYVKDGNNCIFKEDKDAIVQILTVPSLTSTKDTGICNGKFKYTSKSSGTGKVNFRWRRDTSSFITATGDASGTTVTIDNTLINNDLKPHTIRYFDTLFATDDCYKDYVITVTVNPGASLAGRTDTSICSGTLFSYTAISSVTGTSTNFAWTRDTSSYITSPDLSNGSTARIQNTLFNKDSKPHSIRYFYSLSTGSSICDTTQAITVTVNPIPVITSPAANSLFFFCNKQVVDTGIAFKSSSPDSSFTWTSDTTFASDLGRQGNGSIPRFNAINTGKDSLVANVVVNVTANGCPGPSNAFKIIVRPAPALISPVTAGLCNNSLFNYTAVSSDSTAAFSWKRQTPLPQYIIATGPNSTNSNQINDTLNNNDTLSHTIQYFFTLHPDISSKSCNTDTTIIVTVNPTPVVTSPPKGSLYGTYCNGTDVLGGIPFTSSSRDSTFAWTSDTYIGFDTAGSGSIPRFKAVNNTTSADTATVMVKAITGKEHCPGPSIPFTVIVQPTPNIINNKNFSLCSGSPFNDTAISSLSGTTEFSWTRTKDSNITAKGKYADSSAIINDTLINNDSKPHTVIYAFELSAPGFSCIKKDTVTVTVNPKPQVTSPASGDVFTYCNGEFVSKGIPFKSSSPDSSFTWAATETSIGIAGSGSDSIRPFVATDTTSSPVTSTITVSVSASTDHCLGPASSFQIVVNPTPNLISSKAPSLCSDSEFTYKAISSAKDVSTDFSWTRQFDPAYITAKGDDKGSSADIGQVLINKDSTQAHTVKYVFTLTTGSNGCAKKDSIEVTVNPTPRLKKIPSLTVCNGKIVSEIPFNSSAPNSSFNWISDTTVGFGTAGNSSSIPAFIATNTGSTPVEAHIAVWATASSNNCPSADTPQFTVTVNPTPSLISSKAPSLCSDSTFTYKAISSAVGTDFSWTRQFDPAYITAKGDDKGSSADIDQVLINKDSTQAHIVKYIFILTTGDDCSQTETVMVTVNPTPVLRLQDTTFCNRDSTKGIPFNSSAPNSSFSWVSDRTVGFGTEGSSSIPPFIATNTDIVPVQARVTVQVRASSNNCPSADTPRFTITVNPSPLVPGFTSLSGTSNSNTLSLCRMSENINFNVVSPQPPANAFIYEWTSDPESPNVVIKDKNSPNTAISFEDFKKDTSVTISLVSTDKSLHCQSAASQTVKIRSQISDIPELKILKKQPGNILIYPDNSLSRYQWGYDTVMSLTPNVDTITSKPISARDQVYQFYTPVDSICHCIKTNDSLNEDHFYYWVSLHRDDANGGCDTRVYLNGPYDDKPDQIIPFNPDDNIRLQVMPNPNKGNFEISVQGNMYGTVEATIYNSAGQVVFRKRFAKTTSSATEDFITSGLPGGVYFLLLRSSDLKQISSRFIISH